jgi:hypothetical protein
MVGQIQRISASLGIHDRTSFREEKSRQQLRLERIVLVYGESFLEILGCIA